MRSTRFVKKLGFSLLLSFVLSVSAFAADKTPVFVERELGDCINAYTLRCLVTASNLGRAIGEFDGTRLILNRVADGDACKIEVFQISQDGQSIESREIYKCIFENPLTQ